ncbi:hypothetical protein WSS15_20200 [Acetobacter pasteurianus]|nr:hypothetical protein WSS15_20200 [Acetobacter pasteurianus]
MSITEAQSKHTYLLQARVKKSWGLLNFVILGMDMKHIRIGYLSKRTFHFASQYKSEGTPALST